MDGDMTTATADDPIDDGETKAHAGADLFGSEEWIEDLVEMFTGNAMAVVGDRGSSKILASFFGSSRNTGQ